MNADSKAAQLGKTRELILAYGWNSTSYQILNPGIERWFSARGDAVVGYASAAGVRVVAGAPVCPADRLVSVVEEFEGAPSGGRVCYLAAETRLEAAVAVNAGYSRVLLGAQPVWDPREWEENVAGARSLRAQISRARNKGASVEEWDRERAFENPELRRCLELWLDAKGLPPLHFMVEPNTLARLYDRRIFVAARGGEVEGFVVVSPVATRGGWLFEQFVHRPQSPNGTVELMIDAAMRAVAGEGAAYATLGLSPLSTRAPRPDFVNPPWLRALMSTLRRAGRRFYNFDGLDAFKTKLRPRSWEPVYAIYNRPQVTPRLIYAVASVFSGGNPLMLVAGGAWRLLRRGS